MIVTQPLKPSVTWCINDVKKWPLETAMHLKGVPVIDRSSTHITDTSSLWSQLCSPHVRCWQFDSNVSCPLQLTSSRRISPVPCPNRWSSNAKPRFLFAQNVATLKHDVLVLRILQDMSPQWRDLAGSDGWSAMGNQLIRNWIVSQLKYFYSIRIRVNLKISEN